jgi:hypothetical protein
MVRIHISTIIKKLNESKLYAFNKTLWFN